MVVVVVMVVLSALFVVAAVAADAIGVDRYGVVVRVGATGSPWPLQATPAAPGRAVGTGACSAAAGIADG